jgi:hypothetical protein
MAIRKTLSAVITLADGRQMRWHEFGDPDGSPVLYTAGTPVSGLGGAAYDEAARAVGLRWVSPDKPGYGGSDYQRKRSPGNWGDDLAALAAHLGLDHFRASGRVRRCSVHADRRASARRPGERGRPDRVWRAGRTG